MLKSMTGYAKSDKTTEFGTISWEIKSLNSKYLDVGLKLATGYEEKEIEIRNWVSRKIGRGKVSILLSINRFAENTTSLLNRPVILAYYKELQNIMEVVQLKEQNVLQAVLSFPESINQQKVEIKPEEWNETRDVFESAFLLFDEFRIQEGAAMEVEIEAGIKKICAELEIIKSADPQRITVFKQNLKAKLEETLLNKQIDENRFEQELIYYLEKYDISEEIVRLESHIEYFKNSWKGEEAQGKKINFILQEMGRETNTIGSKASHALMQQGIVRIKEELEKIRELSANIL